MYCLHFYSLIVCDSVYTHISVQNVNFFYELFPYSNINKFNYLKLGFTVLVRV